MQALRSAQRWRAIAVTQENVYVGHLRQLGTANLRARFASFTSDGSGNGGGNNSFAERLWNRYLTGTVV
jgi:anti-sigma factor RsiW